MPVNGLGAAAPATLEALAQWLGSLWLLVKVLIGFSIIIFVHELGHFLAAKWVGIRVDRFSVGFGTRLIGYRRGEGITFGNRPNYRPEELKERGYGETDYCFKALPIGGYVKMLGQDDIIIDEKSGDIRLSQDPRAFTSRPVGHRMIVVSAGVVFNLLFAALLLMGVFLIGKSMPAPVIGAVPPDSPAQGRLLPGDRVLAINGRRVDSFVELRVAPILSEGPLRLRVQRAGRVLDEEVVITPVVDPQDRLRSIEVEPSITTLVTRDGEPVDGLENLRRGDRITHVDGQPVASGIEVMKVFQRSRGRILELRVLRPDEKDPSAPPREVRVYQRAALVVDAADLPDQHRTAVADSAHILGMLRRPMISYVESGSPASRAGLEPGDVIVVWGTVANPTYSEIVESIVSSPGRPIPVVVQRGTGQVELSVTPRRPFRLSGEARPRIGVSFSRAEDDRPVVADIVPDTPAAALRIPRGSVLTAIDGHPVSDWHEVVDRLKRSAGQSVELRWRLGEQEMSGRLRVPASIVSELDLPDGALIVSINGRSRAEIRLADGSVREVSLPSHLAVRRLLEEHVGQTVKVEYFTELHGERRQASFTVREDNTDPWPMRLAYLYDPTRFEPQTDLVRTSNPLRALAMGLKVVQGEVMNVYAFMKQIVKRNVGTEHVAGPVGIFGFAMERAREGLPQLLYFLAFLSINLAVINFLPLPVMDGGLMVFLLIEKLKGRPLSVKTQMISTLVGLALIILCGIFVTIQDLGRLFG